MVEVARGRFKCTARRTIQLIVFASWSDSGKVCLTVLVKYELVSSFKHGKMIESMLAIGNGKSPI